MSFIGEEDFLALVEGMMKDLWQKVLGMEIKTLPEAYVSRSHVEVSGPISPIHVAMEIRM